MERSMLRFQLFKILFDLFHIFFQEHQAEADGQQKAGEPDGLGTAEIQCHAAEGCAQREQEDDGEPFDEKMKRLTSELSEMFEKSHELENEIREKLGAIGYEV